MSAAGPWAQRAEQAERAVLGRHLRLLGAVLPGTRLGRSTWPARRGIDGPVGSWNYWWQAHLLDCVVDAQLRAPAPARAWRVAALLRGVRWRNGRSWINRYFDDIAWLGLAAQRAGPLVGRAGDDAVRAITDQLRLGWSEHGGGGIWWRVSDDFKNTPANGPAAILLARTGHVELAASITDWMTEHLVDPVTGLVRDGLHVNPDGSVRVVEGNVYTYCQGVYLGACVELAERAGDPRWAQRAGRTLAAVTEHLAGPDGVLPGHGGGDCGLFTGILVRYLADAALRRLELAAAAGRLVTASATAAWDGRVETRAGPLFAPDWRVPALLPDAWSDAAERDLSVQLSGWMVLEAAAAFERGRVG